MRQAFATHFAARDDTDYLTGIIEQLATAALDTRKQSTLAAAIAQRTLMAIAANAKRRG